MGFNSGFKGLIDTSLLVTYRGKFQYVVTIIARKQHRVRQESGG